MKLRVIVLALALTAACAPPPSIVTDPGKAAYRADQIVLRVNELQNAAIQANTANALPTATTRLIVQFCVDADKTLAAAPSGWQTTIATAWQTLKGQLPAVANPAVQAALNAIDVVLATNGAN